jgi:glycerol-3-phosphate dehydrogenase (NAD(P)+)
MQLARCGHPVMMWDRDPERAAAMDASRENGRYLPGIPFPDGLAVASDLGAVLAGAELVVAVVPSQTMRAVMTRAAPLIDDGAIVACAAKGVEASTLCTMDEVFEVVLPPHLHARSCAISGPSFAAEVARNLPTAVVVAGRDAHCTHAVADAFHGSRFRVYHTYDMIGAELGGALKNVMAIACGIIDGQGLGLNARAALITRGLAEITRLAVARGANPMTLAGLAGMGDLVLTCTGNLSRNRRVGLGLGEGKKLAQILDELGQVAEGVVTTRSARALGAREGVEMPITEQMYRVLYEELPVPEAVRNLMTRERRAELDPPGASG